MLMDEPFTSLDNRLRDEIRDLTLSLLSKENTSVIMVTHDPFAASFAPIPAAAINETTPPQMTIHKNIIFKL